MMSAPFVRAGHLMRVVPPPIVILGDDLPLKRQLVQACAAIDIIPAVAHSVDHAADAVRRFDARLVVVLADACDRDAASLARGPRCVKFGPAFGSADHVLALERGFHEVWPADVSPGALVALLRAALRDASDASTLPSSRVRHGDYSIDLARNALSDGTRRVVLRAKEAQTLALLMHHAPAVVERDRLRAVLSPGMAASDHRSRTVDTQVSRIRRSLDAHGVTGLRIVHARHRGYRLCLIPRADCDSSEVHPPRNLPCSISSTS